MKISESALRRLINNFLLEGVQEDRAELAKKFPESAGDLGRLPPKFITWLSDRFLTGRRSEVHPFSDAIVTVKNFAGAEASITGKWKENPAFKAAVDERFPETERKWQTPTDVTLMSADQMDLIYGLSQRKKQRFSVDNSSIESDRVGKVGPWNLWLPTTRENSVKIAGQDPVTMEPRTTWCTARTAGSNLFYNYIGHPGRDTTLFYIIKDDPRGDWDWLSLGFVNGKPILNGRGGGLSVNRINSGLTLKSLQSALGSDYKQIMDILTKKNKELGGQHPAQKKVEAAAQSVEALNYLIKGLSEEERVDLVRLVGEQPHLSDDVIQKLADDTEPSIRRSIVSNPNLSDNIVQKLANDKNEYVREGIAERLNLSDDLVRKLADDIDPVVKTQIANRKKLSDDLVWKLANDTAAGVRISIAQRQNLSDKVMWKLASDTNEWVRSTLAQKQNLSADLIQKLANDTNDFIKSLILSRSDTSDEALKILVNDENAAIKNRAKELLQKRNTNKLDEMKLRKLIRFMIT